MCMAINIIIGFTPNWPRFVSDAPFSTFIFLATVWGRVRPFNPVQRRSAPIAATGLTVKNLEDTNRLNRCKLRIHVKDRRFSTWIHGSKWSCTASCLMVQCSTCTQSCHCLHIIKGIMDDSHTCVFTINHHDMWILLGGATWLNWCCCHSGPPFHSRGLGCWESLGQDNLSDSYYVMGSFQVPCRK